MAYELLTFSDADTLAHAVAADWISLLRNRSEADAPYSVALSGGRIAKNFFSEIARQASDSLQLFKNVSFFWADERCVPPDDPESNFNIARELLFKPLQISDSQIFRLRGEVPEALALSESVKNILSKTAQNGEGQPIIDMIFLGLGEDGHTASLFPGEPESVMANSAIYRAVTAVKPPPRRITMGYGVIAAARDAWMIASGKRKEEALRNSLSPNGTTPFARVLRQRDNTRILTDIKLL